MPPTTLRASAEMEFMERIYLVPTETISKPSIARDNPEDLTYEPESNDKDKSDV
jgi:hypothetical protein